MGLGAWLRQMAANYVEYMEASALDQHRHEWGPYLEAGDPAQEGPLAEGAFLVERLRNLPLD
jgi:hypothetical protein